MKLLELISFTGARLKTYNSRGINNKNMCNRISYFLANVSEKNVQLYKGDKSD